MKVAAIPLASFASHHRDHAFYHLDDRVLKGRGRHGLPEQEP